MYEKMQVVPLDARDTRSCPVAVGILSGCRNHQDIVDDSCGIRDFTGDFRLGNDQQDEGDVLQAGMTLLQDYPLYHCSDALDTRFDPDKEILRSSATFSVNKQATGITLYESQDDVINIYPNPANDLVTIQYNSPGKYSVMINSMNGQVLYDETSSKLVHKIDLSSFQKGVYYITIRSKDFVTTKKIIKL